MAQTVIAAQLQKPAGSLGKPRAGTCGRENWQLVFQSRGGRRLNCARSRRLRYLRRVQQMSGSVVVTRSVLCPTQWRSFTISITEAQRPRGQLGMNMIRARTAARIRHY